MKSIRILLLLSAGACASSPTIGGTTTSTAEVRGVGGTVAALSTISVSDPVVKALAASPGGAWAQVAPAYLELGIPLTFSVAEARIAGNQGITVRRQLAGVALRNYFLCGEASGGPNADIYNISINLATQIQEVPDGTSKAATVVDATATPVSSGTNAVHCGTTGELERRVNDLIAKRLNLN